MGAGTILSWLGYVSMLQRKMPRASACLDEALPLLRGGGCLGEAARTLNNLGTIHHKLCDWDRATHYYSEALSLYERLGHKGGRVAVLVNLSQVNTSRGHLEPAIAQGEEALQILPEDSYWRCHAMLRIARANYALGDLASACGSAAHALRLASDSALSGLQEAAERLLGEIELLRGRLSTARGHLTHALGLSRANGLGEREVVCLARLSEVEVASEDWHAAVSLADSARSAAQGGVAEIVGAIAHSAKGQAALALGHPEQALSELLAAEDVFLKRRVCDELADVSLSLAKAHLALGRPRFAGLYFRAALDTVEQVAHSLQLERNRTMFLSDPRRRALFDAIRDFRQESETN